MTGGLYLGKSAFRHAYLPSLINVARFEQPVELDHRNYSVDEEDAVQ
jgi:hypothetical protein